MKKSFITTFFSLIISLTLQACYEVDSLKNIVTQAILSSPRQYLDKYPTMDELLPIDVQNHIGKHWVTSQRWTSKPIIKTKLFRKAIEKADSIYINEQFVDCIKLNRDNTKIWARSHFNYWKLFDFNGNKVKVTYISNEQALPTAPQSTKDPNHLKICLDLHISPDKVIFSSSWDKMASISKSQYVKITELNNYYAMQKFLTEKVNASDILSIAVFHRENNKKAKENLEEKIFEAFINNKEKKENSCTIS